MPKPIPKNSSLKRVYIIHLLPLEYYPPITNLLNILSKDKLVKTAVFSTKNNKYRPRFQTKNIQISRTNYPGYQKNIILKFWSFFTYVFLPLWQIIVFKPHVLMYYEPHSALPAYLYKRFFNPRVKLFIHHHEYYAPEEFQDPAMRSVRFFHKLETTFLYKKAAWISQTNSHRLDFFSKDYPYVPKSILFSLANYPPLSWAKSLKKRSKIKGPIKLLYIGALSFENTYIREIVTFVRNNPNSIKLDIFSYNMHNDVLSWLQSESIENISLNAFGIPYDQIPKIASSYDIGLVLYKGHNINYQYNAPNKLFEYLVCGLDVWVPKELLGCKAYLNSQTRPFVLDVNYNNLSMANFNSIKEENSVGDSFIKYNAEDEAIKLLQQIKS
ncbi:MAG: hypothetical protein QMC27_08275 [Flavobacteriaceae bacterium]